LKYGLSPERHPDVHTEKKTESAAEQTRQKLDRFAAEIHPPRGPVERDCKQETDGEHPDDAA
jgi:hypothetical protein